MIKALVLSMFVFASGVMAAKHGGDGDKTKQEVEAATSFAQDTATAAAFEPNTVH